MAIANYPNGFLGGVMIRGVPIVQTNPGKVFWLSNNTTGLLSGQRGGSDGNKGDFNSPFSSLSAAQSACVANRGDIILVKPGHAETISTATALTMSVAGVAVVGLGLGTARPKFTLDTANTATINVSAANVSFQNCQFFANFLSIAACFTLTTAAEFTVQGCYFRDTSSVLNFLNIVKSTGAANTIDGLTFTDSQVINLGVTSNNTTILSAAAVDRMTIQRNYLKWAVQNDTAIALIITTGAATNLFCTDNYGYRPNTTTSGGSLINVQTASTGMVCNNYVQTLTTTADLLAHATGAFGFFDNKVSGVLAASGFIIPAVDS